MYFVIYYTDDGQQFRCFSMIKDLFQWLQEWHNNHAGMPGKMSIYQADCLFDGT